LDGRALTTAGALNTAAINAVMPTACKTTGIVEAAADKTADAAVIYPNPFSGITTMALNSDLQINNASLLIYNLLGALVINQPVVKQATTLETGTLPSGIYFYKLINNSKVVQSGRIISL
jgi:hypothetical protein